MRAILAAFAAGASLGLGSARAQQAVPVEAAAAPVGGVSAAAMAAAAAVRSAPVAALSPALSPGLPSSAVPTLPRVSAPVAPAPALPSAAVARPLRLAIMGPPGSGKGTYGKRIAALYGAVHISVGDLLREYAKGDPRAAAVMATGRLVDSELVLRVVRARLSRRDARERGFLLDGFPRRMGEALALEDWLGKDQALDAVLRLEAPPAELERRILARGRKDDTPQVFRLRMEVYRRETLPVLERLSSRLPVLAPDVSGPDIDLNWDNVRRSLDSLAESR